MPIKSFLTAAEIARRLGLNKRTVQRWCKKDWERGFDPEGYEVLFPNLIKWPNGWWWVPIEEVERVLGSAVVAAGCGNNDGKDASGSRMDAGSAGG